MHAASGAVESGVWNEKDAESPSATTPKTCREMVYKITTT